MDKPASSFALAVFAAAALALSTVVLLVMVVTSSHQVTKLRSENQQLNQRTELLSKALARFSEDQDSVVTVIEEMEAEIAGLRSDYARLGETADNARQRLENANDRLNRLTQIERELQAAISTNEALQQNNAILTERLAASRAEIERLQQALENRSAPTTPLY